MNDKTNTAHFDYENRREQQEEIDFIRIFKTLWTGKWIILIFTSFLTLCSIGYALYVQQWWVSNAIISKTHYEDNFVVRKQLVNFYSALNLDDSKSSSIYSSTAKINDILLPKSLLTLYINEYDSFNNKRDFIRNNLLSIDSSFINDKSDEQGYDLFVDNWSRKIKSELNNKNKQGIYKLSFEATSSKLSHDLLLMYSNYINELVSENVNKYIDQVVSITLPIEKAKLEALKINANKKLMLEIKKANYALKVTLAAQLKNPLQQFNSDDLFPIEFGSQALSEKVKILNKISDLSFIDPRISKVEESIKLLESVKVNATNNIVAIKYLKDVNYPVVRDKPNRKIIVIIGLFLGLVLSSIFVLFKPKGLRK